MKDRSRIWRRIPSKYRSDIRRVLGQTSNRERDWLRAFDKVSGAQLEALAFLLAHMPEADVRRLAVDYVLRNLDYAFRVRHEVPCSQVVSWELFLNYVLPYCQLNERRDDWRSDFFSRFSETARRSASIQDAVLTLNLMVFDQLGIRYHPVRAGQGIMSPIEAAQLGWAGGHTMAIILADACRAVGIPARVVGTRSVSSAAAGLCWVEVWDAGDWHCIAAGVQGTYDIAWFNDVLRETDRDNSGLVFAASFARTGMRFPSADGEPDLLPDAVNVTARYRLAPPTPEGVLEPVYRPKHYLCYRADKPILVDGCLKKPVWQKAPWTDYFVDIEGHRKPPPRYRTRAKILWDDTFLYVGAEMEEPHVWASLKRRNEIIFNDNDFEVFIDPDGDHHHYYEFEVNALNTIWELSLDRPYRDGGPIHRGDNMPGLKSAVRIEGTMNDGSDTDKGWSVEVAIPWSGLKRYAGCQACPPRPGDQWRMNFSRVEWLVEIINGAYRKVAREAHPEDNWVWSPQGAIDMHRPEAWGYVQFGTDPAETRDIEYDSGWLARQILMEVYYRQRQRKKPATSLRALGMKPVRHASLKGELKIRRTAKGWEASQQIVAVNNRILTLHICQDSRLWQTV